MKGLIVTKVLQKLFSTNKLAEHNYLEVIMNKGISSSPFHTSCCSLCISAAIHFVAIIFSFINTSVMFLIFWIFLIWRFKSYVMWCCISGWVVSGISKESSASIVRVKQCQILKMRALKSFNISNYSPCDTKVHTTEVASSITPL